MAHKIVLQTEVTWPEDLRAWEAHFYRVGCAVARALAAVVHAACG
ncbi:hypothetical protein [Thermoflexus sp.]